MPRDTPTAIPGRLLAALALSLIPALGVAAAAAQAQAAAQQEIRLTIPYALLLHVNAHQSTTYELDEGVIVTATVKAPLSLYLHTNDAWRLTVAAEGGRERTLSGEHGVHNLSQQDLDLPVRDGEQVTFTVVRQ